MSCMIGAHVGSESVENLELRLGSLSILRMYHQWEIPSKNVKKYTDQGKLIISSHKPPKGGWKAVASGSEDKMIDSLALAYKALGKPVIFIFHHEPHDDASDIKNGSSGTSSDYVAAWTRIHDRFSSIGALQKDGGNVLLGYCGVRSWVLKSIDKLYPGNNIIDIECHDAYNWGDWNSGNSWSSFKSIWTPLVTLAKSRGHKIIPAEFGCHPTMAPFRNRDKWFINAAKYIKSEPTMIGFCYYHTIHTHDWRLTESDGLKGWKKAFIDDSYFIGSS